MSKKAKTCDSESVGMSFFSQESRNVNADNEHVSDEEKAYRALAMLICSTEVRPKSFVQQPFTDFIGSCNPRFHITFDNIERHCLEIYNKEKARIKQLLGCFDGQISLSLEVLSHEGNFVYDFMCLKAHFIDGDWEQKNWVLNFSYISLPYSEASEVAILKSLSDLDIENKIGTLTLENSIFFDETFDIVKNRVKEKRTLQLGGQIFRVHCCSHTFRLMVEDAFKEIESAIWKIQLLVIWGKSLPLWSLTLHRLQQAIELESKGEFTHIDPDFYDIPSAEEWEKVRGVCKLVGNIYSAAEVLFETKYPTASIYLRNILELWVSLEKESRSADGFVKAMAQEMLKKLDICWKDMFILLGVSTVMDPQHKMKYIEFLSVKYEGSAPISKGTTVLEAIQSLYDDYAARSSETNNDTSDLTASDSGYSGSEDELPRHEKKWRCLNPNFGFNCLDEYNQFIQSNSQPPKSDLELYLEEPVLPWSQNFKVLSWWKTASPKYPTLSKMARDLLAVPLSLATSNGAYYSCQRPADRHLIILKPKLLNALMCTRSWFEQQQKVNWVLV